MPPEPKPISHEAVSVMARCQELARITEEPGHITRTFHSAAMQSANPLVGGWMQQAGLEVWEDAAFNLWGRWPAVEKTLPALLLGSHLDTVRDAGKYDGPLGVLVALAAVERLQERGSQLPFDIEIVGFSDEEGVRYQTTYLGSRAVAGTLSAADLERIVEKGIEKARRPARDFLAYAEVHIEQGPVLEARDLAVGVVSAIASQARIRATFTGKAGHAGTTPMYLRRDALCGAAEFIAAVEKHATANTVATVGLLQVQPGASNVIPGRVELSLDVRDQDEARRNLVSQQLQTIAQEISQRRGLVKTWEIVQETASVQCDPQLTALLRGAVERHQREVIDLPSGAGHDAAVMAPLCPMTMLFVRCAGGISHHPAESVNVEDVAVAIDVLVDFILQLAEQIKLKP